MLIINNSEEEIGNMCKEVEKYAEKYAVNYANKKILNMLKSLIDKGKLTVQDAANEAGMSLADFNQAIATP